MTTRHPLQWLRGIVMELAGVALIIWLASGLPGVPGNTGVGGAGLPGNLTDPVLSQPGSSQPSSLGSGSTAWPWLRGTERSSATAPPFVLPFGPPSEQRISYTQTRLEPAGQALLSMVEDAAAHLLRDLTEAGSPPAGSPAGNVGGYRGDDDAGYTAGTGAEGATADERR